MITVDVLLSTYNGEQYLEEQIESLLAQENVSVNVIARDDGSTDNTIKILNIYQNKNMLSWYGGENLRPARSFWKLLCDAPVSQYYCFCDQDDVWMPDKLRFAVNKMKSFSDVPCLYFSAKRLVDRNLNFIADTHENLRLTLGEAMVYNPVTGCTMVINEPLRKILLSANPNLPSLHDSWIYRTCLAVGGKVIYDVEPHIMYRQHGNNVVGHVGKFVRFQNFIKSLIAPKNKSARSNSAKELLNCYSNYMNAESLELLTLISEYDKSFSKKIKLLCCKKMRTSSHVGRCTFFLYVLLNKY